MSIMDTLVYLLESVGDYDISGKCSDCNTPITIIVTMLDNQVVISGGAIFEPPESYGYEDKYIYKCDSCYKKDNKIHQKCEVYTRVVGYYRPIKQFNKGKLAEFHIRKNFKGSAQCLDSIQN